MIGKAAADRFQPEVLTHRMADIYAVAGREMEEQEFSDLARRIGLALRDRNSKASIFLVTPSPGRNLVADHIEQRAA